MRKVDKEDCNLTIYVEPFGDVFGEARWLVSIEEEGYEGACGDSALLGVLDNQCRAEQLARDLASVLDRYNLRTHIVLPEALTESSNGP